MDKRSQERLTVSLNVEILDPPDLTNRNFVTRDISKTGAFILSGKNDSLPVGRVVSLKLSNTAWGTQLSNVSARVVRVTNEGMGLRFIDFDIM
jgi:c-di-GMP-binding flagellar brake protein YcgR